MARVLLVEDDPTQLDLRKAILIHAGHPVETAATLTEALERCSGCQVVVMDLIPQSDELLRRLDPKMRIIVLSGWEADRGSLPRPVDDFLVKPCPTRRLLESIAQVCALMILLFASCVDVRAQTFQAHQGSEIVAELDLSAPGMDWAAEGHEAALVTVLIDGKPQQNIMLYAGADRHTYPVFLGPLAAGEHKLSLEGAHFQQQSARFREDSSDVLAHAPILYARPNTIGKFTDIPLITYCERLREGGFPVLQYTVIYSNEDAGTSTRALMARWGRTTDIEWVYKAFLNADGTVHHAIIQAAAHKEILFAGKLEGLHPVLITATDNNNVAYDSVSAVRYQIPPVEADLTAHSREELMDQHPFAYVVMAKELIREHKLRPYGVVDGEKVGDPRNYLYFEAHVANQDSALGVLVRLHGDRRWFTGYLGRSDYPITRDGWVRTTVELPPGTKASQIGEIGFECLTPEKKLAGVCEVLAVSKCFFLDGSYEPGLDVWTLNEPNRIPTGQILTWNIL
ncbi:MAG: hypothetical protein ACR2NN_12335 [Bryobacteraceae bacterium]